VFLTGHEKLVHDDDIERCLQRAGDLGRDRYPAARYRQHERVSSPVFLERVRKVQPGGGAVFDECRHNDSFIPHRCYRLRTGTI
jgi:hypothetical protein